MKLVYHIVHRYFPSHKHNEDMIQEGMLGLIKAADSWDESKSKFSTYASTCILNTIKNWLKAESKHYGVRSLDYQIPTDEGDLVPLLEIIEDENSLDFDVVQKYTLFYKRLTEEENEILRLRMQDFTYKEIGEMFGCSRTTIRKIIKKIEMKWRKFNGNDKD